MHTQNNTEDIQMNPLVNPPNIVVDDIRDITLELGVGSHMIINTSAPQVEDLIPSSFKVARLEKLVEGVSNFDHTPISQYLLHPRPLIAKVPMGSKLVAATTSMSCLRPPTKNLSTH